jgi:hypothetical protein
MLRSWCDWLEKTPLSGAIQNIGWIIPVCQIVHILCLALVLSAIVFVDVRLLGLGPRRVTPQALARRFLPQVWGGVAVMAFTGAVLVIGEPRRDLPNPVFQLKMALLASALLVTWAVQHGLKTHPRFWGEASPAWPARLAALLSLGLWLGIAACGRLIAYFMG